MTYYVCCVNLALLMWKAVFVPFGEVLYNSLAIFSHPKGKTVPRTHIAASVCHCECNMDKTPLLRNVTIQSHPPQCCMPASVSEYEALKGTCTCDTRTESLRFCFSYQTFIVINLMLRETFSPCRRALVTSMLCYNRSLLPLLLSYLSFLQDLASTSRPPT